jgi:hypothetical protein
MRKLTLTLTTILAFTCVIFAQQKQAVKVGPLGFLLGNYNARYEKAISDKGSFQIGANYYDYKIAGFGTSGFGLDAGYRHYFKEAIEGAYVFPSAGFDFNSTNISDLDDTKGSYSQIGIGATVGYQWINDGGFLVDLGLGYGYGIVVSTDEAFSDTRVDDFGGGGIRFTFALGYAF